MESAEVIAGLKLIADAYDAALLAVLNNQSYQMPDGRSLTRASLREIREGRKEAKADLAVAMGRRPQGRMRRGYAG
ncbi:MAG: hypothetical protein FJ335_08975 [Sphingomonadales bacterium]|nr:hypothetical protein [Sphingomonadales bacterium]